MGAGRRAVERPTRRSTTQPTAACSRPTEEEAVADALLRSLLADRPRPVHAGGVCACKGWAPALSVAPGSVTRQVRWTLHRGWCPAAVVVLLGVAVTTTASAVGALRAGHEAPAVTQTLWAVWPSWAPGSWCYRLPCAEARRRRRASARRCPGPAAASRRRARRSRWRARRPRRPPFHRIPEAEVTGGRAAPVSHPPHPIRHRSPLGPPRPALRCCGVATLLQLPPAQRAASRVGQLRPGAGARGCPAARRRVPAAVFPRTPSPSRGRRLPRRPALARGMLWTPAQCASAGSR